MFLTVLCLALHFMHLSLEACLRGWLKQNKNVHQAKGGPEMLLRVNYLKSYAIMLKR